MKATITYTPEMIQELIRKDVATRRAKVDATGYGKGFTPKVGVSYDRFDRASGPSFKGYEVKVILEE